MPNSPDSRLRSSNPETTDRTKETEGSSNREGKRKWTPERDAKRSEENTSQRGEILELAKRARQESPEPEKITAFDHLLSERWAPKKDQYPQDHGPHSYEEFRALSLDETRKMKPFFEGHSPSEINDLLTRLNADYEPMWQELHSASMKAIVARASDERERRRKRTEVGDQVRDMNRKKVLLLDILDKKHQLGELSPEDSSAHYDQEREENVQFHQRYG